MLSFLSGAASEENVVSKEVKPALASCTSRAIVVRTTHLGPAKILSRANVRLHDYRIKSTLSHTSSLSYQAQNLGVLLLRISLSYQAQGKGFLLYGENTAYIDSISYQAWVANQAYFVEQTHISISRASHIKHKWAQAPALAPCAAVPLLSLLSNAPKPASAAGAPLVTSSNEKRSFSG